MRTKLCLTIALIILCTTIKAQTNTLPAKFSSAQIVVTDNSGKALKQFNISGSGKGVININASSLAGGVYNYSL